MSRELRDLLEETARGPCDPGFDPADIAAKAGRQRRWGAVAAAVVVVVGLVGGAAWVRSLATGPQAPFVESSPPDGTPAGWQTVQVGRAVLSVPPDWEVRTTEGARSLPCDPFEVPAIWIGGSPAPTCPAPVPPPRHVGIIATPMLLLEGTWPDEQPVVVDGHEGSWIDIDDGKRQYRFPTLDVMLTVAYEPDPQLAEQVLSTLRPADDGTGQSETASTEPEANIRAPDPSRPWERGELARITIDAAEPGRLGLPAAVSVRATNGERNRVSHLWVTSATTEPFGEGTTIVRGHRTLYGAVLYDLDVVAPDDHVHVSLPDGAEKTYVVIETRMLPAGQPPQTALPDDSGGEWLLLTSPDPRFTSGEDQLVVAARRTE